MCTIEEAWGSPPLDQDQNLAKKGPILYDKSYSSFHPISDRYTTTPFGGTDKMNSESYDLPSPPMPQIYHDNRTHIPQDSFSSMKKMIPESEFRKMKHMFKQKYKKKCKKWAAQNPCSCAGTAEHISQCQTCQSSCHKRNELRHNLMFGLLIGIFVLLLINLLVKK